MAVRFSLVDARFGLDGLESYSELVSGETPDAAFEAYAEALRESPASAIWLDVWGIHDPMLQETLSALD